MNEELMFERVRELCVDLSGKIDEISHECNINQLLVSKMFIATFAAIVGMVEELDDTPEHPLQ